MQPEAESMNKAGEGIFLDWPACFQAGVHVVGGKGWNLGRLARYGFPLPVGGVLTTIAYVKFIEHNRLRETIKDVANTVTIANLGEIDIQAQLEALQNTFMHGSIPPHLRESLLSGLTTLGIREKPLAVRSSASCEDSAEASFAGIHDSFLNVQGPDDVIAAIKGCYASLWSTRAVAYRRKMGICDFDVAPAVVIMEMVQAEAAGVAFSCDPRSGREDLLLINANFGLGESVVAGTVEPDEYSLEIDLRYPLPQIKSKRIGGKKGMTVAGKEGGTEFVESTEHMRDQVLSDTDIAILGLLVQRVFAALGEGVRHQDVEWVLAGGQFILVQARPVTTLPRHLPPELKTRPEYWSNGNFRDAMPMVLSTVSWSPLKHALNAILDAPYKEGGYPILEGMQHARMFQGRAYYNLSVAQWNNYDAFGIPPKDTNINLGGHQPEIQINDDKPFHGIRGWKRTGRTVKVLLALEGAKRKAHASFARVQKLTEDLMKKDFKGLDDRGLLIEYSEIAKIFMDFAPKFGLLACASGNIKFLINVLEKGFPGKGNALATALMAGNSEITSAAQGYRLMAMAEMAHQDADARSFFTAEPFTPLSWEKELSDNSPFKQSFRAFLLEYGHRGVYEVEIMNPRWREDPSYLLHVIRNTINTADLGKIKVQQMDKAESAWREIRRRLPTHRRLLVNFLAKQTGKGAELRETSKSVYVMSLEPLRKILLEAGSRLKERGIINVQSDVFHSDWHELISILRGDWNGQGLNTLIEERKFRRTELEKLSPPDLFIADTPQYSEQTPDCSGGALSGLGVAAGRGSGPVNIVRHPDEGRKLVQGDILVAPSTDPAWTPLFLRASGIVMETGGHLSHGAIVAREYGIPAVVNIPGVLQVLSDGQQVTVDGDSGKVYLN